MKRSPITVALVLCLLAAGALLLLTGSDEDPEPSATTTPTTATAPATTTTTPRTTTTPATTTVPSTTTSPAPSEPAGGATAAPLEIPPDELRRRSRERARAAGQQGARTCPDLDQPAQVVDITTEGVSCATARGIIFATGAPERRGFRCEITAESFADVPTIAYACRRTADRATIGYTAVG